MTSSVADVQNSTSGSVPKKGATRRQWLRRVGRYCLVLLVFALADAYFVERNWIEVTHHHVAAPLEKPLKIAHLSDLHTTGIGFRERRLIEKLKEESPDVIVVTGDLIASEDGYTAPMELLSKFHAPLGVWFVRGNWENRYFNDSWAKGHFPSGASLLVNKSAEIRPGVWIVGLDDPRFGFPDLDGALKGVPDSAYKIALFHSPEFFEPSAGRYQLALAGHSHGGQIRIPFVKPFWVPGGVGRFVEGWFEKQGSRLYVTRGIGTSILPLRFLCRPELTIITVGGSLNKSTKLDVLAAGQQTSLPPAPAGEPSGGPWRTKRDY